MGFAYGNRNKLLKRGWGSIGAALVALFFIVVQVYNRETEGDSILILILFIPVITATIQGIHYWKMLDSDYIYLHEDSISMYRHFLLPRKEIAFRDIGHLILVKEHIIVKLKDSEGEEVHIERDWLSEKDEILLRKELERCMNKESAFNTETGNVFSWQ